MRTCKWTVQVGQATSLIRFPEPLEVVPVQVTQLQFSFLLETVNSISIHRGKIFAVQICILFLFFWQQKLNQGSKSNSTAKSKWHYQQRNGKYLLKPFDFFPSPPVTQEKTQK